MTNQIGVEILTSNPSNPPTIFSPAALPPFLGNEFPNLDFLWAPCHGTPALNLRLVAVGDLFVTFQGFKSGLGWRPPGWHLFQGVWCFCSFILKEVVMNSGIPMTLVPVSSQFCIFLHTKVVLDGDAVLHYIHYNSSYDYDFQGCCDSNFAVSNRKLAIYGKVAHSNLNNMGPDHGEEGLVYRVSHQAARKCLCHKGGEGVLYVIIFVWMFLASD